MAAGSARMLTARWRVAALVTTDVVTLKLLLAVGAIIRSEDYAHGVVDQFGVLEAAMPMIVWAVWSFLVGSLILVGVVWRGHFLVWLGHALGAALYLLLALAQIGAAFDGWPPLADAALRTAVPWSLWAAGNALLVILIAVGAAHAHGADRRVSWPVAGLTLLLVVGVVAIADIPTDGIRGAAPVVAMALLHYLFAIRSGPRPLSDAPTKVVEGTAAPEDA